MPKLNYKDYSIEFETVAELIEFLKASECNGTFNQDWVHTPYNPYLPHTTLITY